MVLRKRARGKFEIPVVVGRRKEYARDISNVRIYNINKRNKFLGVVASDRNSKRTRSLVSSLPAAVVSEWTEDDWMEKANDHGCDVNV